MLISRSSDKRVRAVCSFAIVGLMAFPAVTQAGEGRWQLRIAALTMDSRASSIEIDGAGQSLSISTDMGGGAGVGLEYRLSRRLGLDLGLLAAAPQVGSTIDIGWHGVRVGTGITVAPITAGLNIHLTPDSRVDLYAGPLLAYVIYDSFEVSIGHGVRESFSVERDLGFGANFGLDIHLGRAGHWSVIGILKYINSTLEATPSDGDTGITDFDPTIVGVGIAYRF
jgi:outer membrane protein W